MKHARVSPSGYKRWMACPGAYTLQEKLGNLIPPDNGSSAATLGTELHARAEAALKGEGEPCEATQFYVDYCRQAAAADDAEMIVEAVVPLFWSRAEHGYADCVVRTDTEVHIIDYKSGSIPVDAVNNYQLFTYAYGMGQTSTETFTMTIIQGDEAKSWTIDTHQADAIASVIGVKAQAALNPYVTKLEASDEACMWCPCKPFCKSYTAKLIEGFKDLTVPLEKLSDEKQAHLFAHKAQITKTLTAIESSLFSRVSAGESISGVSVGTGRRAAKAWAADIEPVEAMAQAGIDISDATTSKPITVTQAMKLADIADSAWIQPDGKPRLIAGEAYDPAVDFDVLG